MAYALSFYAVLGHMQEMSRGKGSFGLTFPEPKNAEGFVISQTTENRHSEMPSVRSGLRLRLRLEVSLLGVWTLVG